MFPLLTLLVSASATTHGIVPLDGVNLPGATPTAKVQALATREPGRVGLGQNDMLLETNEIELRHGAIVRAQRTHQGVPVIDEILAVRFDATGRPLYFRSEWAPLPDLKAPQITPQQAVAAAMSFILKVELPATAVTESTAPYRLVVSAKHGGFVYLVSIAGVSPWDRRTVLVDAQTGLIVGVRNAARHLIDDANVYIPRPPPDAVLPAPTRVTLDRITPATPRLTDGAYATGLNCLTDDANIRVITCPDILGSTTACNYAGPQYKNLLMAFCGEAHNADNQGDTDGFVYQPMDNVTDYLSAAHFSDPFAEVHAYYHLDKVTRFAKALGHPVDSHTPLKILANVTMPSSALTSCAIAGWTAVADADRTHAKAVEIVIGCEALGAGFSPMDNAFYLGADYESLLGISHGIYVGQGSTADWAYDGDIMYHEYAHGIAAQLNAISAGMLLDDTGIDDSPSALGEGFSDFFAAALTNDPVTGGYAGGRLGLTGGIRRLDHSLVCPDYWVGEEHDDSQGWAGALWAARTLYTQEETDSDTGLTVRVFDRVVYQALATLGAEANQKDAADAVVTEVGQETALADPDATLVKGVFTTRNVLDCKRIRPLTTTAIPALYLEGRGDSSSPMGGSTMTPYAPGPVQLAIDVPTYGGTTNIGAKISAGQLSASDIPNLFGGSTQTPTWDVRFLWRPDQPIPIQYSGSSTITVSAPDAVDEVAFTVTKGLIDTTLTGTLVLPVGTTKIYLALANYTTSSALISDLKLTNLQENPAPVIPPASDTDSESGGCNCSGGSGGALGLVAALTLLRRRRR